MRLMILACALVGASQLAGCGSSSRESQSAKVDRPPQSRSDSQDLLSTDGELFPLSAYYGVCVRHANILRGSINEGLFGYPTIVEFAGGGGLLKITVGKVGVWPGTVLKDVPAISPPRRIQIGRDHGQSFVLVSDFGSENNLVSIAYDETDAVAQAEVMRLANNVVACHISAKPAKANGG